MERSEALVERMQELAARIDGIGDPEVRDIAQAFAATILDLYGEGLRRVMNALEGAGEPGAALRQRLIDDGVVASLLLIHDLYPIDLGTRVEAALEGVRPYLASHGGNVELLGLEHGVARLRLCGSCKGCPSSAATLEGAIRQALEEAAPDLAGIEIEGVAGPSGPPVPVGSGAVPATGACVSG